MEKQHLQDVFVEPSNLMSSQTDSNTIMSTTLSNETRVKALTFNLWGIVGISKHRKERFAALAELLITSESDIDYVFLQEVWSVDDFDHLAELTSPVFKYSHYFHSGVIGSGICLLSKWPIINIFSFKYNLNGYAHKFHHGDWFGGKVVGMAKVQHGDLIANLYITHLHAEYDRLKDSYLYHRVCQAFEFSQFVSHTFQGSCDYTIVAGDFNTQPQDLPYQVILYNSHLRDAFEEQSKKSSATCYGTCGHPENTFTSSRDRKDCPRGQRIDYILYGTGSSRVRVHCENYISPTWKTNSGISLSDHEPIVATLRIEKVLKKDRIQGFESFSNFVYDDRLNCRINCLKESTKLMDESLATLRFDRVFFLTVAGLLLTLLLSSIPLDAYLPVGYVPPMHIVRIGLSLTVGFCLMMGLCWNAMERASILSARNAMNIILADLEKRNAYQGEEKLPV